MTVDAPGSRFPTLEAGSGRTLNERAERTHLIDFLKRPCFDPFDDPLQILPHEIVVDKSTIGVGETFGDRSPHLSIRANCNSVHAGDRQRHSDVEVRNISSAL